MFEDDVVTLICHIAGIDEQTEDYYDKAEDWLWAHHELSMEQFQQVVSLLMPYVPALQSGITTKWYHALGVQDGKGFTAIVKKEML